MQLAIIHYHLNRGGVTRVVENHLRGLSALNAEARPKQALILYGGRDEGWNDGIVADLSFPLLRVTIPELDYDGIFDGNAGRPPDGLQLFARIEQALKNANCDQSSTVVHIHNHSLGKNQQLTFAVRNLAAAGWRLLLQPHDFAEDLRPDNYRHLLSNVDSPEELQRTLYPQAKHVHYATLNSRDFRALGNAQFSPQRTHLLPNSVAQSVKKANRELARSQLHELGVAADRPYVLYPVRAIRRKNLGELLLWAAMFPAATFAVTLAPLNPREGEVYRSWVELAESLELSVLFDVGGRQSLAESYAAADAAVTTSVAEGFGLVFLEAVLADLPLFGRDLPGITADFRQAGMVFPGLSTSVQIPCDRIDRDHVVGLHAELYEQLRRAYRMPKDSPRVSRNEYGFAEDACDFGQLDRRSQQEVVSQVVRDQTIKSELLVLNPCFQAMSGWLRTGDHGQDLSSNRDVIRKKFSLEVLGQQYRQLCGHVLESQVDEITLDPQFGQSILQQFVQPKRLFPIRFES